MDQETKQLIYQIAADVGTLKVDVSTLRDDVSDLKSDVKGLKSDVAELKCDVAVLKTDVAELKTDVTALKGDVKTLTLRADATDFKLDEMHADIDLGFSLANDSFEKLTRHIDGFAAQSIRTDQELAAGLLRDDRLEARVLKLEQRAWYGR